MARFSLRPLFRRLSSIRSSTAESSHSDDSTPDTAATSAASSPSLPNHAPGGLRKTSSGARSHSKLRGRGTQDFPEDKAPEQRESCLRDIPSPPHSPITATATATAIEGDLKTEGEGSLAHPVPKRSDSLAARQHWQELQQSKAPPLPAEGDDTCPALVVQQATPVSDGRGSQLLHNKSGDTFPSTLEESALPYQPPIQPIDFPTYEAVSARAVSSSRASSQIAPDEIPSHRMSRGDGVNAQSSATHVHAPASTSHLNGAGPVLPISALLGQFSDSVPDLATMLHRKIWVKRPNASATLVQIRQDDLVDDVREMILRKYANSLGKTFDAPDMILNVVTRDGPQKIRVLGPEEEMCRVLDDMYPGGQTVDEALLIEIPTKRTPKPSPRHFLPHGYHNMDDYRPHENGTDYFPPMPMPGLVQPTLPAAVMQHASREHHHSLAAADHPRSISVLNTGQVPPLPSPGGTRRHRDRDHRPKYARQHTSSPVILSHSAAGTAGMHPALPAQQQLPVRGGRPRVESSASEHPNGAIPPAPPLPTPPAPEAPPTNKNSSTPPTPNGSVAPSSHLHKPVRPRRSRKSTPDKSLGKGRGMHPSNDQLGHTGAPSVISSLLDASVPPINVLIVEDNIINMRILEGLMKRLKVRWQTAMNGQIAVDKYKAGGFHLVLMDIQMPIMNGLQATKEIRRLERVNGIGVFSSSSSPTSPAESNGTETGTNGEGGSGKANEGSDKLVMSEGLFKSPVIIVALTASSLQSDRHEALAAGCNDFLTKPVDFMWLERKVKEWGCMQALIDFDGWRKWKDYAAKEEAEKDRLKMEKMAKLQKKAAAAA